MTRIRLGVVADDVTGATDLASLVARSGRRAVQVFGVPAPGQPVPDCDVLVVALKSRSIPAAEAVEQSLAAAEALRDAGAEQLYLKYCSTFDSTPRGNIGPVLDALADVVGQDLVVVSPAAPVNGRTIYSGHLFVGDVLLEDSPLRHHPINPMTRSDLRVLLEEQGAGRAGLVPLAAVAGGVDTVRAALADLADRGHAYAVVDAVAEGDLDVLARAVRDAPLVSGAAGLAAAMGRDWGAPDGERGPVVVPSGRAGIVSGSCSARTQEQVAAYAEDRPSRYIDLARAARGVDVVAEARDFVASLGPGEAPLLYTTADDKTVRAIQEGVGVDRAAALGERINGELAALLVDQGCERVILAGGETSGAAVEVLGIESVTIGAEVAPGVPWVVTHGDRPLGLVLKSGNFGEPDMFAAALAMTDPTS
jgi:uncharacterized protein YgbK (DUF1537 family)